jgi:glycerate kinase
MKILCAPDSFKGSISASDAAIAMREGILRACPNASVDCCPIADGGEGTARILTKTLGGSFSPVTVRGPLGDPVSATFGTVAQGNIAILDIASASGLALVPNDERNVMRATSFGVGELIKAACKFGAQKIIVGVGGSACNDGGCGMAQALGVRFLDSNGQEIASPMGGGDLIKISAIDVSHWDPAVSGKEITVACDVGNPLTGKNGAAHIYAAQKGANDTQIATLDRGLENLATIVRRDLGIEIEDLPRCGAAGGLAAGLFAFAGAALASGIDVVLDAVQFDRRVRDVDLCLTGEGRIDGQSIEGKACIGVARRARAAKVPTIALVGIAGAGVEKVLEAGLLTYEIISPGLPEQESIRRARELLADCAERIVRQFSTDDR